ncbi:MAG: hypothetical protein KDE51_04490 [Anaerolineales bacterium]|nr:hypothetical protein [Anaerolineales bacterium]
MAASSSKQQVYINRVAVFMRGGKHEGKKFQPFTCRDTLEHRNRLEVKHLLDTGVWEPVEEYEKRQKAKES